MNFFLVPPYPGCRGQRDDKWVVVVDDVSLNIVCTASLCCMFYSALLSSLIHRLVILTQVHTFLFLVYSLLLLSPSFYMI